MRRIAILLATVGALLLVPVAQAFAHEKAILTIAGTGKGTLVPGGAFFKGSPETNCSYESPGPATGVCETELTTFSGLEGIWVKEVPAVGSEFAGWTFEGGKAGSGCFSPTTCTRYQSEGTPGDIKITATFNVEPPKFPLTINKTGSGTASFDCSTGEAFGPCEAEYKEGTEVTVQATTELGKSSITGWTGCDSDTGPGSTNSSCNVTITGARTVTVNVVKDFSLEVFKNGSGTGTVTSSPAGINCGGTCSAKFAEGSEVVLTATPDKDSTFEGWTGCNSVSEGKCHVTMSSAKEVELEFAPSGPTNRRTLTITKSAGGTGGIGSVTSKAKGINCASACNSAVASMYESTPVLLTAKASTGSTFVKWSNPGGACDESASTTCTVPMAEDESLEAVFGGTSKAIANPQALTLSKGESSGQGTVKATGLTCEADCSSEVALYQGPTGVAPKNKPGKTVVLKALAAYGSELSGWTGCDSNPTPGECSVAMEEANEVTAEFSAKPTATLTVDKAGTGTGTVTSKPKAISCATVCTTQDATVPTGEAVILKEKPATGMTFEGWTGACVGAGETCTVSLSEAGTVEAKFGGSPKAIAEAKALTLAKAGTGLGTVKGTGLTCEVLCTSTVSLYQGPTGIAPKNKPGKTVVLKATSAPGSAQVTWSGCLSEPTPTECSVTMEAAVEVTATFNELP